MKLTVQKKSVSILIPALNEGKNISNLIASILSQNDGNYQLDAIYVISDGSTDDTVQNATTSNKKVRVLSYAKRKGKAYRINKQFRLIKSDLILVIDADQSLASGQVISQLVGCFKNSQVGLTCGNVQPIQSSSLINQTALFGYSVWNNARNRLGNKGMRYHVDGGLLAYSREFAQKLTFPISKGYVDDDSYSFFSAVSQGYEVAYAKQSIAQMKLPSTLTDYIHQMVRYLNADKISKGYFKHAVLKEHNNMTYKQTIPALVEELLKHPMTGCVYLLIQSYAKIVAYTHKPTNIWGLATSTK